MTAAIVIGLMLSMGFAFARELLDTSVRSPRDIWCRVGQLNPALGIIPHEEEDPQSGRCTVADGDFPAPHSMLAEQFRQVRSRLQHGDELLGLHTQPMRPTKSRRRQNSRRLQPRRRFGAQRPAHFARRCRQLPPTGVAQDLRSAQRSGLQCCIEQHRQLCGRRFARGRRFRTSMFGSPARVRPTRPSSSKASS